MSKKIIEKIDSANKFCKVFDSEALLSINNSYNAIIALSLHVSNWKDGSLPSTTKCISIIMLKLAKSRSAAFRIFEKLINCNAIIVDGDKKYLNPAIVSRRQQQGEKKDVQPPPNLKPANEISAPEIKARIRKKEREFLRELSIPDQEMVRGWGMLDPDEERTFLYVKKPVSHKELFGG